MKTAYKALLAIFTMLHSIQSANAQKASPPNVAIILDSIVSSREHGLISNKSIVGAAIGVYWKGQTYYKTYGLADKEKKTPISTSTLFEIGSNTKVFTGLMLAAMMADKKISGDYYIDEYVTVNKKIQQKVKLTDIANHMSGLPTFHDSASLAALITKDTTNDPLMLVTDPYVFEVLRNVDSLHNYGTYEYSNLGVGLLGYILQQKERATYDQLLQRRIAQPLGMHHTSAALDTNNNALAKGYYKNERAPFIHLCKTMQGAGAITSNITDMMRFIQFHLQGTPALQKALTIDHTNYYKSEQLQIAMGWHVGKMYEATIHEMRGDTYGASSLMMFSKEQDLGIVVLLNSANSGVVQNVSNTILSKLLDSGNQNRFAMPEIMVDKANLDAYMGTYELEPGFDATVSLDNGKLALQLTGQPRLTFKAVDQSWFVMEKYNCQLEFNRNEKGVCDQFILHQNGESIPCKRK